MTADEALGALGGTLEQLRQIFPKDKATWDSRPIVRLAVERLWITAGNLADIYRIERGLTTGVERGRNATGSLSALGEDRRPCTSMKQAPVGPDVGEVIRRGGKRRSRTEGISRT